LFENQRAACVTGVAGRGYGAYQWRISLLVDVRRLLLSFDEACS